MRHASRVITVIVLLLAFVLSACQAYPLFVTPVPTPVPQTEINKEIVRRYAEEVWSQAKLDVIDEIVGDGYVFHDPMTPGIEGRKALKQLITAYHTAFPGLHFIIEDLIAEGDMVVARWRTTPSPHQGELMGIPPTGKLSMSPGITIFRLVDGKIVEEWARWDALGMMQQLGLVPAMGREEFGWSEPSTVTGAPGDPETNKAIVRRYTEEVWNAGNLDVLPELMSADVVHHEATMEHQLPRGLEAHKQAIRIYRTAFPDLRSVHQIEVAEGDKVAVLFRVTGTHKGELMGIPPTGKKVEFTGINIHRFADGKIVETWWAWDALGLMQQLGVVPAQSVSQTEINKEIVRRHVEEYWNQGKLEVAKEIHAPDYVFHEQTNPPIRGSDAYNQFAIMYRTAFPDLHFTIEDLIAEGDKVVERWSCVATHQGELMGIPPTGKQVRTTGISIFRIAGGKIAEEWTNWSTLSMLQQLGVIPMPAEVLKAAHEVAREAFNAHDLDGWLAKWTDDAVWDYVPRPTPLDKSAVRKHFETLWQAWPDARSEPGRIWVAQNVLVEEHVYWGTHLGDLLFEGIGTIPPTGKKIEIPHIDIWDFEGDKVKRLTSYLDLASLLVHLGVMPAPELSELKPSFELPDPEPTGLSPVEADIEANARWNRHDLVAWSKMLHPDIDVFLAPLGPVDRAGVVAATELYFLSVPDDYGKVTRRINLGNGWVLAEVVWTGTNTGPYFGSPPTGRPVNVRGAWLAHFDEDGLMTYLHVYYDGLTILQQLGLVPAPEGGGQ